MTPGAQPVAAQPVTASAGLAAFSGFAATVTRHERPGQHLLEIAAFKGGEIRLGGGAMPGGAAVGRWAPAGNVPSGDGAGSALELRYSDRDWAGAPDDADRPNRYYAGRARLPFALERAMPVDPGGDRRVVRELGRIELENADGALDAALSTWAVGGRPVRVLFGPYMGAYREFKQIAEPIAVSWEAEEGVAAIRLRARTFEADRPLQTELYAGSGGAEGGEELAGKPKPLAFGIARGVSPTPVDAANRIYQVHTRRVRSIVARIGAEALSDAGDVSGYAALAASGPGPGEFTTALDVGMLKLGQSPQLPVTADVEGDAPEDEGYADTLDLIALRVLRTFHGLAAGRVDAASFAGLAALGGAMGLWLSSAERPSTAEVLDRLVGSTAGAWGAGRDGRLRAFRLRRPERASSIFFLDRWNTVSVDQDAVAIPRWRTRVGWRRNWTPLTEEQFAGAIGDAARQPLRERMRVHAAADTAVRVRHPDAQDPEVLETLYDGEVSAVAVAGLLQDLFTPDRRVYRVALRRLGWLFELGQVVRLSWPGFGLDGGRNLAIVRQREDGDTGETVLWGWG